MLTLYLSGENLVTINGQGDSVHQRLHFFRKDGHVNECVAKPCFGMGFTNDKGKFSSLENFDQVLHSRHVHGFVVKFWMKTTSWCTSRKRRGLGKFSNSENLDNFAGITCAFSVNRGA